MKKRTSKSASAINRTSSRSGTSARTVGMASIDPKKPDPGTIAEFTASSATFVNNMTPEEFRDSLVRARIVSPGGKLKSKYKR
jgi:hypothetical protein